MPGVRFLQQPQDGKQLANMLRQGRVRAGEFADVGCFAAPTTSDEFVGELPEQVEIRGIAHGKESPAAPGASASTAFRRLSARM